jgi:hypothetical protein
MTRPIANDPRAEETRSRVERAIYDGVVSQWVRGSYVEEALACSLDPRPIADIVLRIIAEEAS